MDSSRIKDLGQWFATRKTWKQRQEKWWWTRLWAYNATRAAVYVVALVALVFLMWLLGKVSVEAWHTYEKHESDTNLEAFRNLMLGLGALVIGPLGFLLAVIRTVSAWKQARVADQKLQTETFATAIDQLAHDKLPIRLGAIYALEGLAKNSPQLHDSIFEALCAYVRAQRPWVENNEEEGSNEEPIKTPADIQTILTVIGRRNRDHESSPKIIDLSDTDLRYAKFDGGHFESVNLHSAHLEHADLSGAHLESAHLSKSHLINAQMYGTYLSGAKLLWTHLEDTELFGAHLEGANCSHAYFNAAHLLMVSCNAKTNVWGVDFRDAANISISFRETVANSNKAHWPADDKEGAWYIPHEDKS